MIWHTYSTLTLLTHDSKEIAAQLDIGQWCDHVLTLVQTGHDGTVAILWNEQYKLTTVDDSKLDSVMGDNVKGDRCCNWRGQKCDKERS